VSVHVVRAGLDWVQSSFSGTLHDEVLTTLERLKTLAQSVEVPQPYPLGLFECMVQPRGRAHWAYVLRHPEFEVLVTRDPRPGAPAASLRLTAFGLANTRPEDLWAIVTASFGELGQLKEIAVSRADVAVDVQGLHPSPEMASRVVCPASYRATHGTATEVQTFCFGKGDVSLRVYDKRAEMAVSGKAWVEESWRLASGYDSARPVHRVEVQLRRKALAELGTHAASQVFASPGALLDFGLTWANLRVPTDDATKTRWPEDPAWTALRSAVFGGVPLQRTCRVSELMSLDRAKRTLVGCAATAGAYYGVTDYMQALQRLSFAAEVHMMDLGTDFAELVESKRRRILSEGV
jgi:hypothetical protein